MSEKALWAATSRTDVLFSVFQVVLKGSLAVLGWYTALTLPPLFTEAGALTLPPTPLSPLIFGLFALCTALDAFWHSIAEMVEEGSSHHLDHLRIAQKIEARLRARIAIDLAAMKFAECKCK